MPKSLADLRAKPPASRPERSLTLCLAPHLVAEVQPLTEELTKVTTAEASQPRRQGEGPSERVAELRSRINALLDEMAEFEGELRVSAVISDGDWRRWSDANPAREKGEPGHDRDQRATGGYVNTDALIERLGDFAVSWNGDPLQEGDWARIFEGSTAEAEKETVAQAIVALYESRLDFPRLRSSLSASLGRLNGLSLPATSESATSGSTDGSPARSNGATTEKVSPAA